ncbi:unnamed protein product [Leptidea sinapis]|uniref:Uncharacterized protein n=1 Tax=Leptidea sinapis TaxID=189913 RepID=A0A5E4QM03_9NEOP|nr:unnamed protein product [Leptidea sinapis]
MVSGMPLLHFSVLDMEISTHCRGPLHNQQLQGGILKIIPLFAVIWISVDVFFVIPLYRQNVLSAVVDTCTLDTKAC